MCPPSTSCRTPRSSPAAIPMLRSCPHYLSFHRMPLLGIKIDRDIYVRQFRARVSGLGAEQKGKGNVFAGLKVGLQVLYVRISYHRIAYLISSRLSLLISV